MLKHLGYPIHYWWLATPFQIGFARVLILTYDDVLSVAEATIKLFDGRLDEFPKLLSSSNNRQIKNRP
jgi:hypothetical protein